MCLTRCVKNLCRTVGNREDRAVLEDVADHFLNFLVRADLHVPVVSQPHPRRLLREQNSCTHVNRGGALIHNQNLGVAQDRPAEAQQLPFTNREASCSESKWLNQICLKHRIVD